MRRAPPPSLAAVALGAVAGVGLTLSGTLEVASAASLGPITKGPYLQGLASDGVVVRVEVDPPAPVDVEVTPVSADPKQPQTPAVTHDGAVTAFHSVMVAHLSPMTRYVYRVAVLGSKSQEGSFTTAPAPDSSAPFSFLLFGDNRTGDEEHAAIVRDLVAAPGDFLIHTGDCVASGSRADEWQTFFDIEASLARDRAIFACVGNHELVEPGGTSFLRYFGPGGDADPSRKLYYSMRWSNARFFFLNAMDSWSSSSEKAWLQDELTKADAEPGLAFRFVVLHHAPWSSGPHGKNVRLLEAGVVPLLVQHKVDLVLAGHDHIYERGENEGLRYVISGGGGAPLYKLSQPLSPTTRKAEPVYHFVKVSVTKDGCDLVATRVDGSVIEKCGFRRSTPSWDCDSAPTVVPASSPATGARGSGSAPRVVAEPSRCGCETVGGPAASSALWMLDLLVVGAFALRRRRG